VLPITANGGGYIFQYLGSHYALANDCHYQAAAIHIVKMKFAALSLALPFVAARVSYDGYKAFHIDAHGDYEGLESSLEGLEYVSLSCESNHETLDIAVSPASLEAFDALQLDATIIAEDVGAHIAEEGELEPYECKIVQLISRHALTCTQQQAGSRAHWPLSLTSLTSMPIMRSRSTWTSLMIFKLLSLATRPLSVSETLFKAGPSRAFIFGEAVDPASSQPLSGTALCMPENGSLLLYDPR
jgi:hypothetical protein